MRHSSNPEFVYNSDGSLSGIYLPADFCAEHEHGIEGLCRALGFSEKDRRSKSVIGIERYRVGSNTPASAFFFRVWETPRRKVVKRFALLHIGRDASWRPEEMEGKATDRSKRNMTGIAAEWDESDARIYCANDDAGKLATIAEAIRDGDACVMIGGGSKNPFDRGGLAIGILSKISDEIKDKLHKEHAETKRLEDAAAQTGIIQRLEATHAKDGSREGCSWYALKPAWTTDFKSVIHPVTRESRMLETAYPVVFFLNPRHQDKFHFGWFTVEDLDDWIAGRGIIIKATNSTPVIA